MTALASNLAAAQFAAKTDRLTAKSETLDKQISTASSIKSMLLAFSTSLGDRVRAGDLSPQPLVANASVAVASLSGALRPSGTYSLEVTQLATAQNLASGAFASGASTVGSGTLTIRFGTVGAGTFAEDPAHAAVDVTIPPGATLAQTAAAINSANSGVYAYVANTAEGARLVLKGQEGAANGFVIEANEAVGDPGLAAIAWEPVAGAPSRLLQGAGNAAFAIDGLTRTATSNKIADAVPGLNLTLTATNAGSPTKITFADSGSAITATMQDLTAALNEIAAELGAATNPLTGELARDSGAQALRRTLSQLGTTVVMPNAAPGAPRTLNDLGLSIQRDGTFRLDSKRLEETLKASPQAAAAMFTTGLYGVFATFEGIARRANATSDPGSLAGSIARYNAQRTTIAADKAKLIEQQEALRARLTVRFAAADTRIGASQSTLSFLQNQIDAWNKGD
jgi:flagellar hook-associated protein 2